MVLLKMTITDQGVGPAWQRQSGARTERFPVLFGLIKLDQELKLNSSQEPGFIFFEPKLEPSYKSRIRVTLGPLVCV